MKNNFKFFQIVLLMCGVCGAETDEEKTVPVMEGESVTLNPDLTKIPGFNLMKWRFRDSRSVIAQIDRNMISYPSLTEMFKDRLKLDQTGSLTITNMRTKHSGLYKLEINHNTGTSYFIFSVTVYESPAVIDAFKGEMKSVSVTEGESVTLQTDTETHGDELIVWRFGDEGKLIAKHDLEAKSPPLYDPDERFRDRLKLDNQTGSLTITNTRITDSGVYKVKISSSNQTLYKRFTVTVSVPGLSSAAVIGIVVGVLLVLSAAAGVFYYRLKVSELQKLMNIEVIEGESVTLTSGIEINKDDQILWLFGDGKTVIAEIQRGTGKITVPDGRFKDRLKIDKETGSLTIRNTRPEDRGVYKLKITGSRLVQNMCRRLVQNLNKRFIVSVREHQVYKSVLKGRYVTLKYETEIQKGDKIQWKFGTEEKLIAEMTGENRENRQWSDEFRDQMKLNTQTGSLIIQQTRPEHAGLYKLEINTSDYSTFRLFKLIVFDEEKSVSVMKGVDVTLRVNPEIQTGDKIFWMFGDNNSPVATNTEEKCEEECEYSDSRFTDIVDLNHQTGDLTIKKIRTDHTGEYKLKIIRNGKSSFKLFTVTLSEYQENESVVKERSVTLNYDTEIQKDDKIQWKFGDKLIAEMTGENRGNPRWFDELRGQMKLNPWTGSLIIQQIRPEHTGLYKIEIKTRDYSTFRFFSLIVFDEEKSVSVMRGADVTLCAKIQTGDKIFWMFGDNNSPVAKNTEEECEEESEDSDYRFNDYVDLNHQTGDLTIKKIKTVHTGEYKLKIIRNGKASFKLFNVTVSGE
ncbi:uncharacterized protein LOC125278243 [Megalobrama amblycephala]|uniref:uncharacterized protein LOC125278243 n=1 Tax=Megalobrama amblycephala TaxID=75352 RepID=UPI0020141990|nr:uncharacterized protein LOC125278243 [Megalobrama amblycephala]